MDMELKTIFSETFETSAILPIWSPCGFYIASIMPSQDQIVVRSVQTEKRIISICQTYAVKTKFNRIDRLKWSPDSQYLSIACLKQGVIQIFSLDDLTWKCTIDLGSETEGTGLCEFEWAPKARHILTFSAHHIQLTIWSLSGKDVKYIRKILPIENCMCFTRSGTEMALARYDDSGRKLISVYDTQHEWNEIVSFECNAKDFQGFKWSPDSSVIMVWDSPLFSNLYFYSRTGQLLKHYSPDGLSRGIQSIAWSPTGQFIAFMNHNNKLRVLNALTYGVVLEEVLHERLTADYLNCTVLSERTSKGKSEYDTKGFLHQGNQSDPDLRSSRPKSTTIKFSWDGKYLAVFSTSFPNELWIWDLSSTSLISVFSQLEPVEDFNWCPTTEILSLVTGNDCLYMWSPLGAIASHCQLPREMNFRLKQILWSPRGDAMTAVFPCSGRFAICFISKPKENEKM